MKEQREVVKANFEAGSIDLDGYLGKIGSISLSTGMAKFSADDEETGCSAPKRKGIDNEGEGEANEYAIPSKKGKTTGAAIICCPPCHNLPGHLCTHLLVIYISL